MPRFFQAHATHPDAHMAMALAAAQIDGQRGGHPLTLGFLYISEDYLPQADALLADARERWPGCGFVGASRWRSAPAVPNTSATRPWPC